MADPHGDPCGMTSPPNESRARAETHLALARSRATQLGDGPLRFALSDEFFSGIEARLEGPLSGWSTWPPLFRFAADERGEHLADLNDALLAVRSRTRPEKQAGLEGWLTADDGDAGTRLWRCGIFELAVKTRFLEAAEDVDFDYVLDNGRDIDIRATVAGRPMCFEATVLTESDEDQGVWARFMAVKSADEDAVLIRPGKYDPEEAKGPSPYYDCSRVYSKVYDKLAKKWDSARSQLSAVEPNVILLSVWTGFGMPYTASQGIGWALDELLADQPNMGAIKEMTREGVTDVSLATFLRREAPPGAEFELIQSPRRIGAVALFNEARYSSSRVNYNAADVNLLSHAEVVAVEGILNRPLPWI